MKMRDSLPMALFRLTHLASVMNASIADSDTTRKYHPWLAFFIPWVLFNESLSHPRGDVLMCLTWLKVVHFYFTICLKTLRKEHSSQHITEYGRSKDISSGRCLFDSKILRL
jgi:hypothetical protein